MGSGSIDLASNWGEMCCYGEGGTKRRSVYLCIAALVWMSLCAPNGCT